MWFFDFLDGLIATIGVAALMVTSGILTLAGARDAFETTTATGPTVFEDETVTFQVLKYAGDIADRTRDAIARLGDFQRDFIVTILIMTAVAAGVSLVALLFTNWVSSGWMGADVAKAVMMIGQTIHLREWISGVMKMIVVIGGFYMVLDLSTMVRGIVRFRVDLAPPEEQAQ